MSKPLTALLEAIRQAGNTPAKPSLEASKLASLVVSGLSYDSRKVSAGDAFFCLPGEHVDGNSFAGEAAAKGAVCLFSESKTLQCPAPVVVVDDVRKALALVANAFYENPSKRLRLLGVTGTNGKTTTTHLVKHILNHAGKRAGLIGTLGSHWTAADGRVHADECGYTTPQAPELQHTLSTMLKDEVTHATMEVSSQALALKRVDGCHFASACLTNITQDHLDFHKTMEQYWQAKLRLFELLNTSEATNKQAIVNLDEPLAQQFLAALGKDIAISTLSWSAKADLRLISANFDFAGSRLEIVTPAGECRLRLKLNGPFNVYNVMSALAICLSEGVSLDFCKEALENFSGVPGRFQIVSSNEDEVLEEPLCIVDYAHTPDGLRNILNAARTLVPPEGKLIAVFGCGGDRDTSKRPQMGEIAEDMADEVIVTSDNPRSENPEKIISEILAGINRLSTVQVESDRAKAIERAVTCAKSKDVIVVAGKGHETYQILADKTISFDDRDYVKSALKQRRNVR